MKERGMNMVERRKGVDKMFFSGKALDFSKNVFGNSFVPWSIVNFNE